MFALNHPKAVQEFYWIAISVIKMFMNQCLSIVPIDFQDGVNDLDVGVNESIFSILYSEYRIWMP